MRLLAAFLLFVFSCQTGQAQRVASPPAPSTDEAAPPLVSVQHLRSVRPPGRVRLHGVVSVGQGELHDTAALDIYLQDSTGGVRVVAPMARPMLPGTPVAVIGTAAYEAGDVVLQADYLRADKTAEALPTPPRLDRPDRLSDLAGSVVTLRGVVVSQGTMPVGYTLGVLVGDTLVYAVRFYDAPSASAFPALGPGQGVQVTGVLGRFRSAYQIYPRTPSDVQAVGLRPATYRLMALVAIGMLLLALSWAVHLVRVGRLRLAALEASQRHFQLLFDKSETGVVVLRANPESVEMVRANPAVYTMLGLDPARFRLDGYRFDPAKKMFFPEEMISHLRAYAQEGRDRRVIRMRGRNGRERSVLFDTVRVMQDGEALAFSFLEDITERLAYEQTLVEARKKAETYAHMQSAFLRNMSHELRTPLAGIIGFAEVLREELDGEPQQFACYIEEAGRRLLGTLQDILDLSRFAAGTMELSPKPLDLSALLDGLVRTYQPRAIQGGLALHACIPEGLSLVQDEQALRRIFEHLLANAFKFTPAGGTITLSAGVSERHTAWVGIEDTGIGMSEDFQQRLFTPYAQESSGYARSHEGAGLGLNLVRTLLGQMQGTIRVSSARGVGTSVTVDLPLSEGQEVKEPKRAEVEG